MCTLPNVFLYAARCAAYIPDRRIDGPRRRGACTHVCRDTSDASRTCRGAQRCLSGTEVSLTHHAHAGARQAAGLLRRLSVRDASETPLCLRDTSDASRRGEAGGRAAASTVGDYHLLLGAARSRSGGSPPLDPRARGGAGRGGACRADVRAQSVVVGGTRESGRWRCERHLCCTCEQLRRRGCCSGRRGGGGRPGALKERRIVLKKLNIKDKYAIKQKTGKL